MNRRPAGAPVVHWEWRRDWLVAARADGSYDALVAQFAKAIAREAARFTQADDILLLVSPSLGGEATLAAAPLLRQAGFAPRIATDRRLLHPTPDGPESDEYRRDRVLAFGETLRRSGEAIGIVEESQAAPVLIDAGFTPLVPFGTPWRHEAEWANHWRFLHQGASVRIAIDNIPFACPNGEQIYEIDGGPHPAYSATLAVGALSAQHVMAPASRLCGDILFAPAQPPLDSKWRVIERPRIDPPGVDAHKYSRGMVVVVAGEMPGAARLAARAAAASGAGYVVLAGERADAGLDAIVHWPVATAEAMATRLRDDRIGAVVIGPGLGRTDHAQAMLDVALACDRPLVLDADALTLLGRIDDWTPGRAAPTWITPHFGEWAALSGDAYFEHGKLVQTAWWAEEGFGMIFKGADTVVATPVGVGVPDRLPSGWLSTAGTGDVLAGILGARLAARRGDWRCGDEAVWLHMRAAELAGAAFCADELIGHIGSAIGECG
jgi:hydroxyethylthiazole kinase-like uncharacterized protein yjeF